MGNLFNTILINPIINVLVFLYQVLLTLHVPYTLGFAIILLTVLIRLVLYPLMATQLKASKKMQDLNPHLNRLKEKHKGDSKRIQEETMKLYKEHGVNPAAGCLPLVIQFPLLIALYQVLGHVVALPPQGIVKYINAIVYSDSLKLHSAWDTHFFGIPLGQHPSQLLQTLPLILLVPLITAGLQFVQSKMMVPVTAPVASVVAAKKKGKELKPADEKKSDTTSEFAQAFQTQSLYIFPLMLGYLSYSFPIGLSLYWNTFTLFGILQQYQIGGWGSLSKWMPKTIGNRA
jgi:YidC/Oxa1 family membrane protein insertase